MGSICWRGVATRRVYTYMTGIIPAALVDPRTQQPLLQAQFNGEHVIACNHDGSVALAVATGPPPGASKTPLPYPYILNDIYDAYTIKGLWEQATGNPPFSGGPGTGWAMFPFGGAPF